MNGKIKQRNENPHETASKTDYFYEHRHISDLCEYAAIFR